MPYVSVWVDSESSLDDFSTEDLREELARREERAKKHAEDTSGVHHWDAAGIADDLRTAFYARNAARFEAAVPAFETRHSPATPPLRTSVAELPVRPS